MSLLELHSVKTEDNIMLDFAFYPPRYVDDFIFVITHGAANTFYASPVWFVGRELAARGFGVVVFNNRGHDWVTHNFYDQRWMGASYELIEQGGSTIRPFFRG